MSTLRTRAKILILLTYAEMLILRTCIKNLKLTGSHCGILSPTHHSSPIFPISSASHSFYKICSKFPYNFPKISQKFTVL